MYIIATAGHVDHGKSTLVTHLTKEEVDRLPEEKRRLLTIELGFAHYINSKGQTIGVIDVPGHERFIRNMVTGMWSLDLALLVVASDDKWMTQTEDHAQILKAMGVATVIGVITKADLAEEQTIINLSSDIQERFLKLFGYKTEIVVTSKDDSKSIEKLKEVIDYYLEKNKRVSLEAGLFIDRSFSVTGIGKIVAGSLRNDTFELSSEVTLLPDNKKGRIRSLQSFAQNVKKVDDGSRVALSLAGIDSDLLKKGSCLTTQAHLFTNSRKGYLLLNPLYNGDAIKVKNNGQYEIASSAWYDNCLIKVISTLKNKSKLCYIETEEPHPWYWNQKGTVIFPGSAHLVAQALFLETKTLNKNKIEKLKNLIEEGLLESLTDKKQFDLLLNGFAKDVNYKGDYLKVGPYLVSSTIIKEVEKTLLNTIEKEKLLSIEIAKNLFSYPAELTSLIITSLLTSGQITLKNNFLELTSNNEKVLNQQQKELLNKIKENKFHGYEVKNLLREEKGVVATLLQSNYIIIIESTFIYLVETYLEMVKLILKDKKIKDQFTIAEARTFLPLSRKYMLPILNQMASDGYLRRIEDKREIIKLLD